ncbi:hypothetical protein SNE40_016121 [Patella caerulea]|uniref:Hexosyltransferase n=1 Tax=Patella caerulea TaxID=87958 RepID=A0AAN8P7P5_PATCE
MVSVFISSFMVKYLKYIAVFFVIYFLVHFNILWHHLETRSLSKLKLTGDFEDRNGPTDASLTYYQRLHDGNSSSTNTFSNFESVIDLKYESSNSTEAATASHYQVPTGNSSVDKFSSCSRDVSLRVFDKRKNPIFNGEYLLNNNSICCGPTPISAIVVVHTAPGHFERRQNVRETYGSRELFLPIEIRVIFLLGRVTTLEMQNKILRENSQYGDIIQGNFIDAYHNLTLKAVMGLHWVSHFCSKVKYVIKTDDDVMFDMWRFLELVHAKNLYVSNTIYCISRNRDKIPRKGKWALGNDFFKGQKNYPFEYCIGFVIIYSSDVIPALYRASYVVPFLWLDDVYVTGMLRTVATNITIIPQGRNLTLNSFKSNVMCLKYRSQNCSHLAFGVRQSRFRDTWNLIMKRKQARNPI